MKNIEKYIEQALEEVQINPDRIFLIEGSGCRQYNPKTGKYYTKSKIKIKYL